MKQVLATLRDRAMLEKDVGAFVNRELSPVVKELRRRYNERHGEYVEIAADYAVTAKDEIIGVNATAGAVTITLLPAADAGCWVTVVKLDASANAVTTTAAALINGLSEFSTTTQWAAITFVSTGSTYTVQSTYP